MTTRTFLAGICMLHGLLLNSQELFIFSRLADDLTNSTDNDLPDFLEYDLEDLLQGSESTLTKTSLSAEQQIALEEYLHRYGPLLTPYELLYIDGFTVDEARSIAGEGQTKDTVRTPEARNPKRWRQKLYLSAGRRIERSVGYEKYDPGRPYSGSRDKLLVKYDLRKGEKFRAGFVAEKDAGESLKIPDFTGGFLTFRTNGPVQEITVGDYTLHFGTGLAVSQKRSFPAGPGRAFIPTRNVAGKFSAEEINFMRGIVLILRAGKFHVIPFASCKKIDARIVDGSIIGLPSGGLHRTATEIDHRKKATETCGGLHITYTDRRLESGMTMYYLAYHVKADLRNRPYQFFDFYGKDMKVAGSYVRLNLGKLRPFGEITAGSTGGWAVHTGVEIFPEAPVNLSVSYFRSSIDFNYRLTGTAYWGNEAGLEGVRIGASSELLPGLRGGAAATIKRQEWISYLRDQPASILETSAEVLWDAIPGFSYRIRHRSAVNPRNDTENFMYLATAREKVRHEIGSKLGLEISPSLVLNFEVGFASVRFPGKEKETGTLVAADLHYGSASLPFRLSLRVGHFETSSFDSRIYSYERDLPHAMSIPAYSGNGMRAVGLFRYDVTGKIRFYLRCAVFYFPDEHETGSGADLVDSNRKTDVKAMLMFDL